jgi:hypothetical protein
LGAIWASGRPELVFVLGPRRVGKSFLLAPWAQEVRGIYYQASRRSEAEQLRALTRICAERFDDPALRTASLESWDALLAYVVARAGAEPFALVLDEYPYLEEAAPGLTSVLQRFWDHAAPGTQIKLVLSGSYVSAMKRLDDVDQPLHARRTHRMTLAPFDAKSAGGFFGGYEPRDRLLAYATFGHLPGRLALIDPKQTVDANIVEHILDPSSRLYDEAQLVLDSLRSESALHHSILSAIARGERTWRGITKRTGKSSGSLSRPLSWLLDMGLVLRDVPITEADPSATKRALYRIADPYLVFWHRFVAPLAQAGLSLTADPSALWTRRVRPAVDDHLGAVFEEVSRQAVAHGSLLPFEVAQVGRWWTDHHEIDVVARSLEGDVFVGECKWGTLDRHDFARLRAAAEALTRELGSTRSLTYGLFSGGGLADDDVRAAVGRGEALSFGLSGLL